MGRARGEGRKSEAEGEEEEHIPLPIPRHLFAQIKCMVRVGAYCEMVNPKFQGLGTSLEKGVRGFVPGGQGGPYFGYGWVRYVIETLGIH